MDVSFQVRSDGETIYRLGKLGTARLAEKPHREFCSSKILCALNEMGNLSRFWLFAQTFYSIQYHTAMLRAAHATGRNSGISYASGSSLICAVFQFQNDLLDRCILSRGKRTHLVLQFFLLQSNRASNDETATPEPVKHHIYN
jgi:hypothetical protein